MRGSPILLSCLAFFIGVSGAVFATEVSVELLAENAVWKYRDVNSVPPSDWMDPDFDDSGWASGPAELGFGDSGTGEATTKLTRGSPTFYFRTTFNVTQQDLSSLEADGFYQIVVNLLRDDGAILYINGFELMRSNMDAFAADTHNLLAEVSVGGTTEQTWFRTVHEATDYLVKDENVVAVSIHQATTGSSDISLNLAMTAHKAAPQYGVYLPPQKIDFDGGFDGGTLFEPDPNQGHTDLGWYSTPISSQPAAFGSANRDPVDETLPLYNEGYAYLVNWGSKSIVSQNPDGFGDPLKYRVDLRNYVDVKVGFDVRCYDHSSANFPNANGFDNSDYFQFYNLTSDDGTSFTKTLVKELRGGGTGGGGLNAIPLIVEAAPKRALVPTNGNLAMTWIAKDFDDASWHSFSGGGVGYDSGADYLPFIGYDTKSLMSGKNATCYMRIPFEVTDKDDIEGLTLYMRDDDGFIAYINGHEVASFNKPGSPAWNSTASANNPDGTARNLKANNISAHLDKLVNGSNVLAIHALNQSTGSSDFLVSATLEGFATGEVIRNDPPTTLDDINFGHDGGFYHYEFDVPNTNSYTFEMKMSTNEGNEVILFDNFTITGTPLSVDGYDAWVQLETSLVPDESGHWLADPDRDGLINYLEFAFGSDPEVARTTSAAGTSLLPRVEVVEEGGQYYFEMTWRQIDAPTSGDLDFPDGGYTVYDVKYIPQFSTDGVTWVDAESQYQGDVVGEFVENGDGTLDVTMRYKSPIAVGGGEPALLGRVKVRKTSPYLE